ncbi:MAG: nucleotidyltransferase domain-containing protein, partial [Anaerolineales bacterium]|nr:nucleotidyltransferase domain-containing protein [Anaerolineales bacterium]
NVTYSDINNTAALIEVAQKRGDYTPDLSFGTHFFQDLVESSIRYIPLYPDNFGIIFNLDYLMESKNTIKGILPDFAYLEDVIRVIDVKNSSGGQVLQVLMNADKNKAIALIAEESDISDSKSEIISISQTADHDEHWRWRLKSAETIAEKIDTDRFGVKGVYLIGSTKNATAGPKSDIDLLIHFDGSESQKKDLLIWLEGWSLSLSQTNFERTGYKTKSMLNSIFITDEDIKKRTSYALKIGAVTDAAMPLSVGVAIGD